MTVCSHSHCDKPALVNYSVCNYHREFYRTQWQSRAEIAIADGLCVYCRKKAIRGTLRCKSHTLYNKNICKAWNASNKQHKREYDRNKKTVWRKQGRCANCSEHNKLTPPFVKCEKCRKRDRERN